MATTDTKTLAINLSITELRSFYNFLHMSSMLDSNIYLTLSKSSTSITTHCIKFNPSINAYNGIYHTIDSLSIYEDRYNTFFSQAWVGQDATIQTYWDGNSAIEALFNARELMGVIKRYKIEDDNAIRLTLNLELDPVENRIYWARSISISSTEVKNTYDGGGTAGDGTIHCSFEKTRDNGYAKLYDVLFYRNMSSMVSTAPTNTEIKYSADLTITSLRDLYAAYPIGEISYDVSAAGRVYFNNLSIVEAQPSAFSMGQTNDAFGQLNVSMDSDVTDEETNFAPSSPNQQNKNGDGHPHTLLAPQFNVERIRPLIQHTDVFTGTSRFTLQACHKGAYAPENGMGGWTNPELKWIYLSNGTPAEGARLRMRINATQKPFDVRSTKTNNDFGRYVEHLEEIENDGYAPRT